MSFGGTMLAMSAVQGITSISSGYAQAAESKYNASLYSDQAAAVAVEGSIQQGQMQAKGSKMLSTQTAVAGAAGIQPTGSVAAVMVESQRNILTDMAIANYNTTMSENYANAKAKDLRIQASDEVFQGYAGAFSDTLKGVSEYGMYTGKFNQGTTGAVGAMPESTMG